MEIFEIKKNSNKYYPRACPKCGKKISYSNLSTHTKNCIKKQNKTTLEILKIREEILHLKEKIFALENENKNLLSLLENKENEDFITFDDIIKSKSENTKELYSRVWQEYNSWCAENSKKNFLISSAINYFQSLQQKQIRPYKKHKNSTLNTIRNVLSYLMQIIFNKNIRPHLKKVKFRNLDIKKKCVLENYQIKDFLLSQINNSEMFLMFYILIFSAVRVHTISLLRKQDYDSSNHSLMLFDSKTQHKINFELSGNVVFLMENFLKNKKDESFIFLANGNKTSFENMTDDEVVKIRGKFLSGRIIKILKENEVFSSIDRKKYSIGAHLFRKCAAIASYKKALEFASSVARNSIQQSKNSSAVYYYTPDPSNYKNNFYGELLNEIDEMLAKHLSK